MLEECGFPHPRPLPQAGEGKKGKLPGALWIEKFPRPFRWERARVRVISLFAGERKLIITSWSSSASSQHFTDASLRRIRIRLDSRLRHAGMTDSNWKIHM